MWRIVEFAVGATVAMGLFFAAAVTRADTDEFSEANLLTGALFLPTGSGPALIRSNVPWAAPTNLTHPALVFAVGFATAESVVPGKFFDSFTITVRDASNVFVAPIVSMDAVGTTFAPQNPSNPQFAASAIKPEGLVFPAIPGTFPFRSAWLVMVTLPPELIAQSGTLRVSLFNNQDTDSSIGFINHVVVVPGPGTLLALESSAAVNGPYALEGGVSLRHARRSMAIPLTGARRFFKLGSAAPTQITSFDFSGNDWFFRYHGGEAGRTPRLLSSAQVTGPYAEETGVAADLATRTLRIPQFGAARFFRLNSEVPLTIRKSTRENGNIIMRYE